MTISSYHIKFILYIFFFNFFKNFFKHTFFIFSYIHFNKVLFEQNYSEAVRYINDLVNEVNDPIYKGYLMLQESKYYQFIDPTESQKILSSAQIFNHHILKPASGVKKINDLNQLK